MSTLGGVVSYFASDLQKVLETLIKCKNPVIVRKAKDIFPILAQLLGYFQILEKA